MEQTTTIYQNLESLNIILFWKIAESQNVLLLDKEYSQGKEYSEEDQMLIKSKWLELYDEYFKLKNSSESIVTLKENDKTNKESFKIQVLNELYRTLQILEYNSLVIEPEKLIDLTQKTYKSIMIAEPKVRIKELDSRKVNSERLKRVIEALVNKVQLKSKRMEQEQKKEAKNFYKSIAAVEQVLERSFGDIDKINVLRWLAYEEQAEEIIKQRKKNGVSK